MALIGSRRSMMRQSGVEHDAVVIGSGPNGLTAAAYLARAGLNVRVIEAASIIGGGTRTSELTVPGFLHDECSAVHPLGCLSPAFNQLDLQRYGLSWCYPPASVAHPLEGQRAALLWPSLAATASQLQHDDESYRSLLAPFLEQPDALIRGVLGPILRLPEHPLLMARFGFYGVRSAASLARRFKTEEARALLAGCAAHAVLPLDRLLTGGVALLFLLSGHLNPWPVVQGGSSNIALALQHVLQAHAAQIETEHLVQRFEDLPKARAYLFDLAPAQLAAIAEGHLPSAYLRRLKRFRMGPGVFKVDWALDGPIPWQAPECKSASTVHVGGRFEEIAEAEKDVWNGRHPERPFLIVCQQSLFDASRAPTGKHTGYAYCHVPHGSTVDSSAAIERQVERFAPGFRDRILARRVTTPADLERHNPSYVGGAITGGVSDWKQMLARPVLSADPYRTPNPKIFICSQSTPPGGGVHGMCGYYAAKSVLRRLA